MIKQQEALSGFNFVNFKHLPRWCDKRVCDGASLHSCVQNYVLCCVCVRPAARRRTLVYQLRIVDWRPEQTRLHTQQTAKRIGVQMEGPVGAIHTHVLGRALWS